MSVEISIHNVQELNLQTKTSGDTRWLSLTVTTDKGEEEITLFSTNNKPIKLTLGEPE